jgi:hypothetical protein
VPEVTPLRDPEPEATELEAALLRAIALARYDLEYAREVPDGAAVAAHLVGAYLDEVLEWSVKYWASVCERDARDIGEAEDRAAQEATLRSYLRGE